MNLIFHNTSSTKKPKKTSSTKYPNSSGTKRTEEPRTSKKTSSTKDPRTSKKTSSTEEPRTSKKTSSTEDPRTSKKTISTKDLRTSKTQTVVIPTESDADDLTSEFTKSGSEQTETVTDATLPTSEFTQTAVIPTETDADDLTSEFTKTGSEPTETVTDGTLPTSELTQTGSEPTQTDADDLTSELTKSGSEPTETVTDATLPTSEFTQTAVIPTETDADDLTSEFTKTGSERTETVTDATLLTSELTQTGSEPTETKTRKNIITFQTDISNCGISSSEPFDVYECFLQCGSEECERRCKAKYNCAVKYIKGPKSISELTKTSLVPTETETDVILPASEFTQTAVIPTETDADDLTSEFTKTGSERTETVTDATLPTSEFTQTGSEPTETVTDAKLPNSELTQTGLVPTETETDVILPISSGTQISTSPSSTTQLLYDGYDPTLFIDELPAINQSDWPEDCVQSHNYFRTQYADSQTNGPLTPLTWSDELAASAEAQAQEVLRRKPLAGEIMDPSDHSKGNYGENMAGTDKKHMDKWRCANGIKRYDKESDAYFKIVDEWKIENDGKPWTYSDPYGNFTHFSQLTWRNTSEMGCAYAQNDVKRIEVCHYFPSGNIGGVVNDVKLL